LLAWYGHEARALPWRTAPVEPYRVWLSEIMLQQTTVKAVTPYFIAFVRRWPTLEALADASLDDVLAAWAGLGYYSRARNLHKCARILVERYGGRLPQTESQLLALPGVGPYTGAAIAAIAFGARATPVDGNIERVIARLFAVQRSLPSAKPELRRLARALTPAERAGDFAQALMDLGATICTAKRPSCPVCPARGDCRARALGLETSLPARAKKRARPIRVGLAFLALRQDGRILLRRRPDTGLLGGMLEVPSTDWGKTLGSLKEALRAAPLRGNWRAVPGVVVHTFTHFRLEMQVYRARIERSGSSVPSVDPSRWQWLALGDLDRVALPSLMRKIIAHGLAEQ
jgi:A/G-specific adenine glycosylase